MLLSSFPSQAYPEKDELTQDFAVGRQLEVLFDICCSAFAAFLKSSWVLELDFSKLKVEKCFSDANGGGPEMAQTNERMAVISSRRKFARSLTSGTKKFIRTARRLDRLIGNFNHSDEPFSESEREWQEKDRHVADAACSSLTR